MVLGLTLATNGQTPKPGHDLHPVIPRTWDDQAMARLEVPLANPAASPKHVFAEYYYKIRVRPIYRSYPVYAPSHEPPGYMDGLRQKEPVVFWDDKGQAPSLKTEADWISAGEVVFGSPIGYGGLFAGFPQEALYVSEREFYSRTGTPVAADGTVPFYRYVVTEKGQVKIGILSLRHVPHPRDAGRVNPERGPGQLPVRPRVRLQLPVRRRSA
jgi:hypothetical protein